MPRALGKTSQVPAARPSPARFPSCPSRMCDVQTSEGGVLPSNAGSEPGSLPARALPTRCVASGAPGSRSQSRSPLTCASCGVFCAPQPGSAADLPFPPGNLMTPNISCKVRGSSTFFLLSALGIWREARGILRGCPGGTYLALIWNWKNMVAGG